MTQKERKSLNARVLSFEIFLAVAVAFLILRLFIVSVGQHGYYKALAENQHGFFQKLDPNRGEIYISDKYSNKPYPVATNAVQNSTYAVPKEIKDIPATVAALAPILQADPKELADKLVNAKSQYVPLAKIITDDQSKQITAAKLPGIYLSAQSARFYPEGDFLSQVLGFVGYRSNSDLKNGLYGLEKYFDKNLAGQAGQLSTEADFKGNWIMGSNRTFNPAVDGTNLLLTIDRSIQFKAESVLKAAVQQHGADSGSVIIENPKTGAILAMANYPSFDPNNFGKQTDPKVYQNAATTENYEPGSTMKAITLASALDQGLITPDTTFTNTGSLQIDGYTIHNSEATDLGVTTMKQVIDHSLNTGAVYVEGLLGNDNFLNYLKKFGFGKATDLELPETGGDISNLKPGNAQVNFDTAAFGQGITVTPIQMLQSYQVLANGGVMMQPYIIDSKIQPDGTVQKTDPKNLGQIVSQRAASLMSAMLVDDVENGYGKRAAVKGYYIGGKTGTAQVAVNGSYKNPDNIGSFVGYGPIENPQFVMIVNINHPRDVKFAESTAAPAFGEIANFILNYYQVAPNR